MLATSEFPGLRPLLQQRGSPGHHWSIQSGAASANMGRRCFTPIHHTRPPLRQTHLQGQGDVPLLHKSQKGDLANRKAERSHPRTPHCLEAIAHLLPRRWHPDPKDKLVQASGCCCLGLIRSRSTRRHKCNTSCSNTPPYCSKQVT